MIFYSTVFKLKILASGIGFALILYQIVSFGQLQKAVQNLRKIKSRFLSKSALSWCGRWDLNPYALAHAPQTCLSASSSTTASEFILSQEKTKCKY